jgi:hypothetical protein
MENKNQIRCDCPAGYEQNHSIYCALVKERRGELDGQDNDADLLEYPRCASTEAINLGIE